jgi:endo-1,4-beta-xylanase
MKKLLAVITCVLMISAVFIVTPSATEPDTSAGQKVALAAYGTPTIDGHIDLVWDKAPAYNIDQVYVTDELTESSATFQVLWDENYLYILHEVQDNTMGDLDWENLSVGGNLWKRDAISYTFSPDYDRSETTTQVAPAFWCIIGVYGNTANWNNVPQDVFISEDGGETKMFGISYMYEGSDLAGYIIEAKFKLSSHYPDIKMEAGTCIGFDTYTNDNNYLLMSTSRNFGLGWSDPTINSYKNNSLKGTIQLVAKGETIVTTPVETTTETPGTSETPGTTKTPGTTEAPATTKAPDDTTTDSTPTTTAPEPKKEGCKSSVGIVSLTVCTLLGSCLIIKKKKVN